MTWGVVSTVKARPDAVLAFVAHHLSLGAARIWLCFDDPDDPAADALPPLPQITVLRCDAVHWAGIGMARPDRHQNRQTANAQAILRICDLPWLAHIDVDEFLLPDRPIATILSEVAPHRPFVRAKAWEALHCPDLPDDVFTSNVFRAPLNAAGHADHRQAIFGPYADYLPTGVLSHAVGKCFFRTGVPGLQAWLHGASRQGAKVPPGPPLQGVVLLHFHSQDPEDWIGRLPYRLERGAYVLKPELADFLRGATPDDIRDFYHRCLTATPEAVAWLREHGLLREVSLGLRDKVAALLGQNRP